jgi:hypothetical protein
MRSAREQNQPEQKKCDNIEKYNDKDLNNNREK